MWPDRSGTEDLIILLPLMHTVCTLMGLSACKHCNVVIGLEEDPGVVSGCRGLFGSP